MWYYVLYWLIGLLINTTHDTKEGKKDERMMNCAFINVYINSAQNWLLSNMYYIQPKDIYLSIYLFIAFKSVRQK